MLSHSAEICKRRDADSFKTSEGVSASPHYHYIVTRSRAPVHRSGKRSLCRRTNTRIYDKVKRSQEETPKRDTQSASPDIIAARRKAGPGRTTRKREGNLPNP